MPRARRLALTFVAVTACAAAVLPAATPAQERFSQIPQLFGTFKPEPGAWARYGITEKETGNRSEMRMAVVGKENGAYWYEVVNDDKEHRNVIKMLVAGNPNEPENIKRLILKSGDAPAQEMPKDFVAMGRKMAVHMFQQRSGVPAEEQDRLQLEKGETREVVVPAGTIRATLHRILGPQGKVLATYDFNPDILPFGVVTSDTGDVSMQLLAYGSDARSVITEAPVPMTTPPGMPKGMPRGIPPGMGDPASTPR